MNTVVEGVVDGSVVRRGGTASMDRTFAGIAITQVQFPCDDEAWSKDDVGRYVGLLRAIEAERVLRQPHEACSPFEGELWDDYVARLGASTGRTPPDVFAIQPSWPPDVPARWGSLQLGTSDGKILMGWMVDLDEVRRRMEAAWFARVAEQDRPHLLANPKDVERFSRAVRRIERHVRKQSPRLRGILADIKKVRETMGLARSRRGQPCGLDETARFLAAVARADRHRQKDRRFGRPGERNHRGNADKRLVGWAFERAAEHVQKLAAKVRSRAQHAAPTRRP